MHKRALVIVSLLGLAFLAGGCITDVCRVSSGQVELKVRFTGFDLNAAETLEVESIVRGPGPAPGQGINEFFDRRYGTFRFSDAARSTGSETFVLDPGAYIMGFQDADQRFSWDIIMRVYDDNGLLLAEGRYKLDYARTNGCYLAKKMTVSGAQTCDEHEPGDPCVSSNSNPWVCKGPPDSLECSESTCGDGYIDRRHGELCDPDLEVPDVECHLTSCLPAPFEVTLTDGNAQWNELPIAGPPRRSGAAAVTIDSGTNELVLLYGGMDIDGAYLDDTWTFDGNQWQHLAIGGPPPRANHAMAWDPDNQVVVLYGGYDGFVLEDTWTYSEANGWQQVMNPTVTGGTLLPLYSHAMAWDAGRSAVVLYGGRSTNSTPPDAQGWVFTTANNTWTFEWEEAGDKRYEHSLTYVPELGGLLVLGGQSTDANANAVHHDVHVYDGSIHARNDTGLESPKRTAHQALYSATLGEVVLFGGFDRAIPGEVNGMLLRSTHTCAPDSDTVDCTKQSAPDAPHGRRDHVMFELNDTIYVYGGLASVMDGEGYADATMIDDTWQLTHPAPEKSLFALSQGLKARPADESVIEGLYDLDASTGTQDRARAMLISDLDGDGRHELALGLPGSDCLGTDEPCGRVLVKNHHIGDMRMGEYDQDMMTILGEADPGRRDTWLGAAIAAGDINGDGARDLVIGAPNAWSGGGALYVIFGGNGGELPIAAAGDTIQVGNTDDYTKYLAFRPGSSELAEPYRFGAAVAVGDFNGDGLADVVASSPLESSDPTELASVYALPGPGTGWPSGMLPDFITNQARLTVTSDTQGLRLGYSLAAGDVDGDGFADLIVGSAATGSAGAPEHGAVAVIWGGTGFFSDSDPRLNVEQLDPADGVLLAPPDGTSRLVGMGGVVTTVDLDGDGASELVTSLGRPDRVVGDPRGVALFAGADFIDLRAGSRSAADLMARATAIVGPGSAGFGASLTAGDTNGDRHPDLIIGAPYQSGPVISGFVPRPEAGAIYVVLGSPRASYFAETDTTVAALLGIDVSTQGVNIPLIVVRGNENYGFFGNAAATSSHIVTQDVGSPEGYTLVYQPGWFDCTEPRDRNRGRVWTLFLAGLLGCENDAPCPVP